MRLQQMWNVSDSWCEGVVRSCNMAAFDFNSQTYYSWFGHVLFSDILILAQTSEADEGLSSWRNTLVWFCGCSFSLGWFEQEVFAHLGCFYWNEALLRAARAWHFCITFFQQHHGFGKSGGVRKGQTFLAAKIPFSLRGVRREDDF